MPAIKTLVVALLLAAPNAFAQTVYLAGDSTMAKNGGGSGFTSDGWGQYLGQYLTIPVVNRAIGGRSARSFTREGRFTSIANELKSGDIVVIEFGHNDGGGLGSGDNGRSAASGTGSETQVSTYNGVQETVHTFPWYLEQATALLKGKGATVIISSQTPNNGWTNGKISAGPRFVAYAELAAKNSNVQYVDHYTYTANEYNKIGEAATAKYFGATDHTHTTPAGAQIVAQAFVKGIIAGNKALANTLSASGKALGGGGSVVTTTRAATSTTRAATTTRASSNCAVLYGQCGGQGWTGATCCTTGTCKVSNAWRRLTRTFGDVGGSGSAALDGAARGGKSAFMFCREGGGGTGKHISSNGIEEPSGMYVAEKSSERKVGIGEYAPEISDSKDSKSSADIEEEVGERIEKEEVSLTEAASSKKGSISLKRLFEMTLEHKEQGEDATLDVGEEGTGEPRV
ncbi:hypothetical protein HDV00_001540 [Rhizophlyctis rosea]|nr:hypothetical protein HDV00_001540 [Rhizophlyctis rosea]